jgi:hypothetical protein
VVLVLAFSAGPGCSESDSDGTGPGGPFQLLFRLDASFQGAHGGQPIAIAIVRTSDGSVVLQANGAVSATQDPSFTWSTGPVMQAGIDYEVHYWIDSNFGGGTSGVCDPKAIDHQWSVEFMSVSNDITWTTSHEPALTEDVCSTFP